MADNKFLNQEGLEHFWGAVSESIANKQNILIPDETISLTEDSAISVKTPVKTVTEEEYAELSDEDKGKDILYVVSGSEAVSKVLTAVFIDEFDTEDGWHVRKWSNGYVEMSFRTGIVSVTSTNGNGAPFPLLTAISFPITLIKKYTEHAYICNCNYGSIVQILALSYPIVDPTEEHALTKTGRYWIVVGSNFGTIKIDASILITGRWK